MKIYFRPIIVSLVLASCATSEKFQVSSQSAVPGTEITWMGERTELQSSGHLRVGEPFPNINLTGTAMKESEILVKNTVHVISVVPSLDTPVCEIQTHLLGETKILAPTVRRVTISPDLPYAQRRFAEESKLRGIAYFSDYRTKLFGDITGLRIMRNDLLARAVIVVDQFGTIRHLQVVPEIIKLPDLDRAFAVANALVGTEK